MEVRPSTEQHKNSNTAITVRGFRLPSLWDLTQRRFVGTVRDKDCLDLEVGADSLSLKVGKKLLFYAA
jgi:hypothetical protein